MESAPCNPVIMRRFRGAEAESWHRGAFCVTGPEGLLFHHGDPGQRIFLRSGAKFFQAAANLMTGIETRFSLNDRHIALMAASHGGEPGHVSVAADLLDRGGLGVDALGCGAHAPLHGPASFELKRRGEEPGPLHNNCSGKHAGMLLAALAAGEPVEGYLNPDHPRQRAILELFCAFAEVDPSNVGVYVDGCSAPTFVTTLHAAATAFRNFGSPPARLGPAAAAAAARIRRALSAEPFYLGGTARFCTALAEAGAGSVMGKVGAEGFYGAFHAGRSCGLALHVDDGAAAGSEGFMGPLLRHLGWISDAGLRRLERFCSGARRNHRGLDVGRTEFLLPPLPSTLAADSRLG